ncbi:MAG: hypothetical protein GXP62_14660 [Oligoflexia bacterium]|nr:hypothetical protein [Oligoflexia bacterium]
MFHLRLNPSLFPFVAILGLLWTACGSKPLDDTGTPTTTTTTDTGDTGTTVVVPVWTDVSIETSQTITGVYVASTDEAWVTMSGGQTRLWQAASWNTLTIDVDDQDLNGIWGTGSASGATVVAVGDAGYIAEWGASGWDITDLGTVNFESVDGASSSDLMAVGWGGIYSNSGGAWAFDSKSSGMQFNHVWYDGTEAAAVGQDGILAVRIGGKWVVSQDKDRRAFYGVSGTSAADIYAVGEGGVVLHWDGTAWSDISPDTDKSVWAVWAANAQNVYIVGNSGLAMVYRDGGWTDLPTGATSNLYAVDGAGVNDVWAVGSQGTALRYQP